MGIITSDVDKSLGYLQALSKVNAPKGDQNAAVYFLHKHLEERTKEMQLKAKLMQD